MSNILARKECHDQTCWIVLIHFRDLAFSISKWHELNKEHESSYPALLGKGKPINSITGAFSRSHEICCVYFWCIHIPVAVNTENTKNSTDRKSTDSTVGGAPNIHMYWNHTLFTSIYHFEFRFIKDGDFNPRKSWASYITSTSMLMALPLRSYPSSPPKKRKERGQPWEGDVWKNMSTRHHLQGF